MYLSIYVVSYYKLVKDLVEKISKNSSFSTCFILLIFSTRYFNSNLDAETDNSFSSCICFNGRISFARKSYRDVV